MLFGALQGAILAALLWFNRKGNRLSNRLLAALVGLLGLASFAVGIPVNPLVSLFLDLTPLIITMPMGPLIYFYSRSLVEPDFRMGKPERRHFWAVLIDLGSKLIVWVFIFGVLLGVFDRRDNLKVGHLMDEYNTYSDIPRWISVTVYLLLTHRWLQRFRKAGPVTESQLAYIRWLRPFLTVFLAFQVIWLIHLVPYLIPTTRNALLDAFGWYPIYIPIAMMIYWLGLRGYIHARNQLPPAVRKTTPAPLPKELLQETAGRLQRAMTEDKLYLNPELTVDKLGRHVQLPPKTVSAVLNQHLGKSFNSFVNEYRIDEVKRRLNDPASASLTLTGIAFESGFNSQATFQRTFKQATGVSPKEYLNRQPIA